jgi:hypothetical protein
MNPLFPIMLFVLAAGHIAPLNVLAQPKKGVVPTSRPSATTKWQEQDWQKWKMKFSIPPGWRFVEETTEDHPDKVNGYHKEERQFTREPKSTDPFPNIDLSITVTTWPGPTANIQGQTSMLRLTPEEIMNAEQGTPDSWEFAKRTEKKVEDTKYKELSGWKGVYTKFWFEVDLKRRSPENLINLGWTGYRLFEGNIQRIWISFEGKRKELILLERILDSFGFQ